MPRKSHFTALALVALSLSSVAAAQSNPFQPPAAGGGLSKAEVQRIAAEEAKKNAAGAADPNAPSGSPVAPGTGSIPSQPMGPAGAPAGMISGPPAEPQISAVDKFFEAGGVFVGCVGSKPMFATKGGKRAYFTSKDLRKSNEARHLVRC